MASPMFRILAAFLLIFEFHDFAGKLHFFYAGAQNVGVNYGRVADNLPPPNQVISMYKSKNIKKIRLFDPNPDVLKLLQNSGIQVILTVVNNDLPALATNPALLKLGCISLGNELIPSNLAASILPAMQALKKALSSYNLAIPVSTAVSQNVISSSYPPSAGSWNPQLTSYILPIVQFLHANKYPLLCNVYPFFSYRSNPQQIRLDYALLSSSQVIVHDGSLGYTNLLDASVDAIYAALEKVGAGDVEVIVTETGWPSGGGGIGASIANAQTYNNNVINRLKRNVGTPKRPGRVLDTYIFAFFNEDCKNPEIERNFGLFYPNLTPVYPINW